MLNCLRQASLSRAWTLPPTESTGHLWMQAPHVPRADRRHQVAWLSGSGGRLPRHKLHVARFLRLIEAVRRLRVIGGELDVAAVGLEREHAEFLPAFLLGKRTEDLHDPFALAVELALWGKVDLALWLSRLFG